MRMVALEAVEEGLGEREPGFRQLKQARRPRVVVVEDEENVSRALLRHLRHEDYLVRVARDGIEALSAIAEHEPDVILLDLGLPHLHGFKLLHRLREQRTDAPVVVLTGDTSPETRARALRAGVRRVLIKPTPASEVVAAIDEVLREG